MSNCGSTIAQRSDKIRAAPLDPPEARYVDVEEHRINVTAAVNDCSPVLASETAAPDGRPLAVHDLVEEAKNRTQPGNGQNGPEAGWDTSPTRKPRPLCTQVPVPEHRRPD